jgi:hypothetical protein
VHESWLPREHPLHRPRHGQQRGALVAALAFFLVPTIAFVFGVRPQQIENRPLAGFPSIASGWGFFTGLSGWATDNLPLRDSAVHAESGVSQGIFGEEPSFSSEGQSSADGVLGPLGSPPAASQPSQSGSFPNVIQGSNGWLYYGEDIEAKCLAIQPVSTTIADLEQLRSAVEASGRKLVLAVAPDKTTALPQNMPANYPGKQCAQQVGQQFWSQVTSQAGALDLRTELRTMYQMDNVPSYYKQDTHWTDAGALAMLHAVAEDIQPGVSETWRSSPGALVTHAVDLPPLVGQSGTGTDRAYLLSPDGSTDRTGAYGDISNQPVTEHGTPTSGMISAPVSVLGDSFLGPATRYLPAIFSNVTYLGYGWLGTDPGPADQAMIDSHVIVLEVVERNLTSGTAPFLQPSVIGDIRSLLAAHPVH